MVLVAQFTRTAYPVVKLRLLLNSSYRAVFGIVVLIGAGSFTMLYVVPVFLGTISGYNAEQTGSVAMYTGMATFMMMPRSDRDDAEAGYQADRRRRHGDFRQQLPDEP